MALSNRHHHHTIGHARLVPSLLLMFIVVNAAATAESAIPELCLFSKPIIENIRSVSETEAVIQWTWPIDFTRLQCLRHIVKYELEVVPIINGAASIAQRKKYIYVGIETSAKVRIGIGTSVMFKIRSAFSDGSSSTLHSSCFGVPSLSRDRSVSVPLQNTHCLPLIKLNGTVYLPELLVSTLAPNYPITYNSTSGTFKIQDPPYDFQFTQVCVNSVNDSETVEFCRPKLKGIDEILSQSYVAVEILQRLDFVYSAGSNNTGLDPGMDTRASFIECQFEDVENNISGSVTIVTVQVFYNVVFICLSIPLSLCCVT